MEEHHKKSMAALAVAIVAVAALAYLLFYLGRRQPPASLRTRPLTDEEQRAILEKPGFGPGPTDDQIQKILEKPAPVDIPPLSEEQIRMILEK